MRPVKKRWSDRVQPWLGAALLSLGVLIAVAAYERGGVWEPEALRQIGPAGFLALAGLGMVLRARGGHRWLFLLGAAATGLMMWVLLLD